MKTSLCANVQLNRSNFDFNLKIVTYALFPPGPSIVLLYIVLRVNKITANNFNICVLLVFWLLNAFFLKVFVEQFLRNFCQPSFVFQVFLFLQFFNFLLGCRSESTSHEFTSLSDAFHIALGNHALHAQPTDCSLIY